LGIPHIYTWQEILCLQDITNHTAKDTFTGHLYRASLEYFIIEVGVGNTILEKSYRSLHFLATPSLIKNTWQFLSDHNITLKHDIRLLPFRVGYIPIMSLFLQQNITSDTLSRLNICRLQLNVYFLSELMNKSGSSFKPHILQGMLGPTLNRFQWPRQGEPANQDWNIWKTTLLQSKEQIHCSLDAWSTPKCKRLFFSLQQGMLFKLEQDTWLKIGPVNQAH
jgi:hypothetical protein